MVVLRGISIQCAKLSLGRWLDLGGPGVQIMLGRPCEAGWLEHLDLTPSMLHAIWVEEKCKKCYSPMPMTVERVPAVSACLVDALGFCHLESSCPLNHYFCCLFVLLCSGWVNLGASPQ